jgi:xylan 1,4-beta-xylosidase
MKDGVRAEPDVSAMASADNGKVFVLAWHYHDDDVPGPEAAIDLTVKGLPADAKEMRVTQYRIDGTHSNAFAAWKRMGSPQSPIPAQYAQLEAAGKLASLGEPTAIAVKNGTLAIKVSLPRQAVALFEIERP